MKIEWISILCNTKGWNTDAPIWIKYKRNVNLVINQLVKMNARRAYWKCAKDISEIISRYMNWKYDRLYTEWKNHSYIDPLMAKCDNFNSITIFFKEKYSRNTLRSMYYYIYLYHTLPYWDDIKCIVTKCHVKSRKTIEIIWIIFVYRLFNAQYTALNSLKSRRRRSKKINSTRTRHEIKAFCCFEIHCALVHVVALNENQRQSVKCWDHFSFILLHLFKCCRYQ